MAVTALGTKKDELNSWASTHAFSLLNLNDAELQLPYYAIRCKRRKMAATIKRLRHKHPRAELIFQHRRVPNAVNLYDRLRGEKLVRSHHNYCIPATDEVTLRAAMTDMCGEQFPPTILLPSYSWIIAKPVIASTPVVEPAHVVFNTPPASPPYLPPSYHICTQCNRIEPSLLHLYIHQQNCNYGNYTSTVQINEPVALLSYAPIPPSAHTPYVRNYLQPTYM